jgi:hypothetical protein
MDPSAPAKPSLRERFNRLIAECGALVLWVYFGIFALVLCGFALAISLGFHVQGAAGAVGTWGAAYLATKLTQPLRIAATLALTPTLAGLLRRWRKKPDAQAPVETPHDVPPGAPSP